MPGEPSSRLRLFVACELPSETRRALGELQQDLQRSGAEPLRWVRTEGIHITLKFLGPVPETSVGDLRAALSNAIEPFELRLTPAALGSFGGARIRVVWVGLEGNVEGLSALAARVHNALDPLGYPRESRPFAAHLTLARVPDRASVGERRRLDERLRAYSMAPLASMVLREVSLMQSTLSPSGATYKRLASFPARGAAPS